MDFEVVFSDNIHYLMYHNQNTYSQRSFQVVMTSKAIYNFVREPKYKEKKGEGDIEPPLSYKDEYLLFRQILFSDIKNISVPFEGQAVFVLHINKYVAKIWGKSRPSKNCKYFFVF